MLWIWRACLESCVEIDIHGSASQPAVAASASNSQPLGCGGGGCWDLRMPPDRAFYTMQTEADVADKKEALAQSLFDHIPVGVGSQGIIPTTAADLEASLEMGMDWSLREVACHAETSLQCI